MPGLNETSLLSYQNFDGSNTTMLLRSFGSKKANEKLTCTLGLGGSTNFKGKNSFVLEGNAKYNIDEHFNVQTRLRNSFAAKGSSSQLRLSPGYKTKVNDNLSIYINPYTTIKYDYKSQNLSTDLGAFSGVTYQMTPNHYVSGEIQKYNGLKGGAENFGVNIVIGHTF